MVGPVATGDREFQRAEDSPAIRQPSVLLVDDHRTGLDAAAAALEPLGAHLVAAGSAADALHRLLVEDFAVILLDVEMPGMNGLEAARVIRSRKRSRATPLIFMTASDRDPRLTLAGYHAGAVDVLYKPLDPDILCAKVGVFLELFRLRDANARSTEAHSAKDRFLATMSHEMQVGHEPLWTGSAVAAAVELSEGLAAARSVRLVDRKRTRGGSGLGLSISLQLARLMGGDINPVGRGDTGCRRAPPARARG